MASNILLFAPIHLLKHPSKVGLTYDSQKVVKHADTVYLTPKITLSNVLYIPDFTQNLLCVGRLLDQNKLTAQFDQDKCFFQDLLTKQVQGAGLRCDGLYKFYFVSKFASLCSISSVPTILYVSLVNTSVCKPSLYVVRDRLGHPSVCTMEHLPIPYDGNNMDDFSCKSCIFAKHHTLPFSLSYDLAKKSFDMLHINL